MDITAFVLSRVQFGFTMAFHIIFPAFTIGLAAWLAFLEVFSFFTGKPVYRKLFEFWLRVFAIAFGMGVVSGIVMEFQFGTNWSELARRGGSVQGDLLAYESFSAFALEASFFGVLLFGRKRVPPVVYLISALMVSLGTNLSSFWILANNSWMQHPVGFKMAAHGVFAPTDWTAILFNRVAVIRFLHMVFAAYVTTSFCIAATGAWYIIRKVNLIEARTMLAMSLRLAAILVPCQLFMGHLVGGYVSKYQPSKISALEGRWHSEKPASEVLIGWPDPALHRNLFQIALPAPVGSLIDSESFTAPEIGITDIPAANRPPVLVVFFTFRIMVGLGLLMLALAWGGTALGLLGRLERAPWLLWPIFLSFPAGFVATLCGWFTAEVGRQPWVIYGQMRTADALSPHLTAGAVAFTVIMFATVYAMIFAAGTYYIYKTLRDGPDAIKPVVGTNAKRPLAAGGGSQHARPSAAE